MQDASPGPSRPRDEAAGALPGDGEAAVAVSGRWRDRRLGVVRLIICNEKKGFYIYAVPRGSSRENNVVGKVGKNVPKILGHCESTDL